MSVNRIRRVNELLKREIADCLFREIKEPDFNPAIVSVTRVGVSRDLHSARVYISIAAEAEVQQNVLSVLQRHRSRLQQRINRDIHIKYTPLLSFHLDSSIAEGDHVLDLIAELEDEMEIQSGAPEDGEDGNGAAF